MLLYLIDAQRDLCGRLGDGGSSSAAASGGGGGGGSGSDGSPGSSPCLSPAAALSPGEMAAAALSAATRVGGDGSVGLAEVLRCALSEPLHPEEQNGSAVDKSARPFFPVRLRSRALRSFKSKRGADGGYDERGGGLWSKRPHISKVPTQDERMIALQSRVDETHKAVTERMGRLEAMLAQMLASPVSSKGSFKYVKRRLNGASATSSVLRGAEREDSRTRSVHAPAAAAARDDSCKRTPHAAAERQELREEARLDEPTASVSTPFDA